MFSRGQPPKLPAAVVPTHRENLSGFLGGRHPLPLSGKLPSRSCTEDLGASARKCTEIAGRIPVPPADSLFVKIALWMNSDSHGSNESEHAVSIRRPHRNLEVEISTDATALEKVIAADCVRIEECAKAALSRHGKYWLVLTQMLLMVHEDARAVHIASQTFQLRAQLVLCRALFETCVNTMRLIAGGEKIADEMIQHANQKFFRDRDRVSEIEGGWRIQTAVDNGASIPPDVVEMMAKFTSKSGREKTSWIEESIEDKIAAIATMGDHFATFCIQQALMGIYRHSSEVLHGTYYGALFSLGLGITPIPDKGSDPKPAVRRERCTIALHSAAEVLSCTVRFAARAVDSPQFGIESQKALTECIEGLLLSENF